MPEIVPTDQSESPDITSDASRLAESAFPPEILRLNKDARAKVFSLSDKKINATPTRLKQQAKNRQKLAKRRRVGLCFQNQRIQTFQLQLRGSPLDIRDVS